MPKEEISNQKIINATSWSVITEFATKFITPFVNIVLARLLLPEAFGLVATINMVVTFADMFTDAGFQKYIIQHEFSSEEDKNRSIYVAFWSNLIVSIFVVVGIIVFRLKIAEALGTPELATAISIASLSILCTAFSSIQISAYRRALEFKKLFYLRLITACVPIVVTIPLALFLRSYWALVIGTVLSNLLQILILATKPRVRIRLYYSITLFKEMFSFASFTLLENISIWFTTNIDIFLVGKLFSSYYLGLYKTSMSTVNSYMNILTSAITTVLFASLSRVQNDDKRYNKIYFDFQKKIAILIMPMGVGIYVFRDFITSLLLGKNWIEASDFIGLWGLINSLVIIICYFASEVFRSKGRPGISVVYQVLQIFTVVLFVLMSANNGYKALYICRSLATVELILSALIIVHVLFKISAFDVIKNIYLQAVSSIVMGVVGWALLKVSNGYVWAIVSIVICISVYFGILFLTPLRKDLLQVKKMVLNTITHKSLGISSGDIGDR